MKTSDVRFSETTKLGSIRAWSIDLNSCRHATELCKTYCYASKGNFTRPKVLDRLNMNFELSKRSNFVKVINGMLSVNERYIRIHSAGDFYSQPYFNKWVDIAKSNPDIIFLAYTRNYQIDLSNIPDNLKILYSIDDTTKKINPTSTRFALVGDNSLKSKKHLAKVTIDSKKYVVCNSDNCESCLYCYKSKGNVVFPNKYKQPSDTRRVTTNKNKYDTKSFKNIPIVIEQVA